MQPLAAGLSIEVEVPADATPGDLIEAATEAGSVEFVVPEGVSPGDTVTVNIQSSEPAAEPAPEPTPRLSLATDLESEPVYAHLIRERECDLTWQRKEQKFTRKLEKWMAAKIDAFQRDPEARRSRTAKHGSRAQYDAFLRHSVAGKRADAQRSARTVCRNSTVAVCERCAAI
jgi:hypothetical protein